MGSELLLEEQELSCGCAGFKGLATPPVTTTATEKWRKRWTLAWGPGERGKCSVFSSTRLDGVTGDQVLTERPSSGVAGQGNLQRRWSGSSHEVGTWECGSLKAQGERAGPGQMPLLSDQGRSLMTLQPIWVEVAVGEMTGAWEGVKGPPRRATGTPSSPLGFVLVASQSASLCIL